MKADNEIESPDTINNKRQTHIPMPSELAPTPMVEDILNDERVPGEAGAQSLLASSPKSYMYNQIYGLWFFASLFILVTIITHKVSTEQYGILAVIMTAYNTILYIVSLARRCHYDLCATCLCGIWQCIGRIFDTKAALAPCHYADRLHSYPPV